MNELREAAEEIFTVKDFMQTYDIGNNSQYLQIQSAADKGRLYNKKRPLSLALTYPYIAPNTEYNISWLVYDIDRVFDFNEISDLNLEQPNIIVTNLENGHAHLWYLLKEPIWKNRQSKPYEYYKAVYRATAEKLSADPNFKQALIKNPFYFLTNPDVKTKTHILHNYRYSLLELCQHLDLNDRKQKAEVKLSNTVRNLSAEYEGVTPGARNESIFDYVRKQAYTFYGRTQCTEEKLFSFVSELALTENMKNDPPLSEPEVLRTSRSISEWTVSHIAAYNPQKKSAYSVRYTDKARSKSLQTRRKHAAEKICRITKLLKRNKSLSVRQLAIMTGYSVGSIKAYMDRIRATEKSLKAHKSNVKQNQNNRENSLFLSHGESVHFVIHLVCATVQNKETIKRDSFPGDMQT